MIDTDKYEGHTEGPWKPFRLNNRMWTVGNLSVEWQEADKNLIADAPLLLEAFKHLRKELKEAKDVIQYALEMSSDDDSTRVFEDYLEVIE